MAHIRDGVSLNFGVFSGSLNQSPENTKGQLCMYKITPLYTLTKLYVYMSQKRWGEKIENFVAYFINWQA